MNVFRLACVVPLLLASACSTAKSESPLSPSVAGPIAGVSISLPKPVQPAAGARLMRSEPVVLTIENASTTGVRPLSYTYEGSTDASFSTQVFRQTGVEPGANGRTSLPVPGPLSAGQTYYWRVQATDGANSSEFSPTLHFIVVEPFILLAPAPISPSGGGLATSLQPTLRTANADRSGPPEAVTYLFEVSTSDQFGALAYGASVPEQADYTAVTVSPLPASTTFYWRVRAQSSSSTSGWSASQAFATPSPAAAPAPAPPGRLPPSNPGPRPRHAEGLAMVAAVIDDMRARGIPMSGDCGAFEIARRVAWAFRNRGAGLERKPGGRNCQGHSIDIIMFTDGMTVDVLVGGGVDNGPSWQEHGPFPELLPDWVAPTNPD